MIASSRPPLNPATAPHSTPSAVATTATASPISSESRPPIISPAEDVEAVGVGAERVRPGGPDIGDRDVRVQLIGGVDQRAHEAEQDQPQDQRQAGGAKAMAAELADHRCGSAIDTPRSIAA